MYSISEMLTEGEMLDLGFELIEDEVEYSDRTHPLSSAEKVWENIWLFGIIVDDDLSYYFPDEEDTSVPLISIDTPPVVNTAYDARPL